ncbi:dihydroneopterin aldolase [Alkalihalobacillus sp. AL-G]|uniref:dihydroneopterin aldolase n=1 Tax=Alkalihalobacillus sp. AL-G TaxID=2926399 RepID=UPI00272B5303|nr:dihydroneopterin aldolase [Alkalihalobacillus sp. AL-G]WLD93488.1 dihydroneopterin aldolase [Alkalihalobacillus sp. AL-G]
MDKIYINDMKFYGYHGVYPEEQKLGQRFNVDLVLECDLSKASRSDDIEYTVHYGQAYEITKNIVEGKPRKLVETVAEKITEELLNAFPIIHACTVKVFKPDPPIPGHYESVAIEIARSRHE